MKNCLVSIFVILALYTKAQGGFKREYKLPYALHNETHDVIEVSPGSYVMGGFVVDTINGIQVNRLTLFGINSQGQRTWTKKYGTKKFEYLNNTFVLRWFYKRGNFFYYTGVVRDSNNYQLSVLIKFNFNGDTIWQRKFYDVPTLHMIAQRVTGSVDGGFLMTGFFEDFANSTRPLLLIKTDANGNELWRKQINKAVPNVHDGKAIVQDSLTKKIIIGGYQYIGNQNAWSINDNLLICDSLGNKLSQHNYNSGVLGGLIHDLVQIKEKRIVAVGQSIYPQTLGGINLTRSFAVKIDLNTPNIPVWKIDNFDKTAWGNTFLSVEELSNEDLLLGGSIDTMKQNNLPVQVLNRITKLSKHGQTNWNRYYDYSKNKNADNQTVYASLHSGTNNHMYAGLWILNLPSPNPFGFVKYDSTGCDSTVAYCNSVGIEERKAEQGLISTFPNPVINALQINFSAVSGIQRENVNFFITDISGRAILEGELKIIDGNGSVDLSPLDKGVYFLRLSAEGKNLLLRKVLKE